MPATDMVVPRTNEHTRRHTWTTNISRQLECGVCQREFMLVSSMEIHACELCWTADATRSENTFLLRLHIYIHSGALIRQRVGICTWPSSIALIPASCN